MANLRPAMQAISIAAFSHAGDRNVKQFARGEQGGIAEGGDDSGIDLRV